MSPINEDFQRFLHGEINLEELKDRSQAWKVAEQFETERIKRFHDVEYVNIDHMQWLPNFGLYYLSLEQIVSLVVSDLGWKDEWLSDETPDPRDSEKLTNQIKSENKSYEEVPKRLLRQLLDDVDNNRLPHVKPPKRFASYVQKENPQFQPSQIYVHFDDLIDWLLKTQYADRRTIQKTSTILRYEETEQKCKDAILSYAKTIRIVHALNYEQNEETYVTLAKHFVEDIEEIEHRFAQEALNSYWSKVKNVNRTEKPLPSSSRLRLLQIIRAVSMMKPSELVGPHAVSAVKLRMEKNGHKADDETIRKYLTEAGCLPKGGESL